MTDGKRPRGAPRIPIEERFWPKVNKLAPGGCWLWTASINEKGHGNFRVGDGKTEAHRVSYKLAFGEIPRGHFILHRCRVRACVNPAHLFLGCGPNNHKLTLADVSNIRASRERAATLAERYGVSRYLIKDIQMLRRWGNNWQHSSDDGTRA